MNDKVTRQIETMKRGYILDPNRILADYRKEIAEIRGIMVGNCWSFFKPLLMNWAAQMTALFLSCFEIMC